MRYHYTLTDTAQETLLDMWYLSPAQAMAAAKRYANENGYDVLLIEHRTTYGTVGTAHTLITDIERTRPCA